MPEINGVNGDKQKYGSTGGKKNWLLAYLYHPGTAISISVCLMLPVIDFDGIRRSNRGCGLLLLDMFSSQ